MCFFLGTHCGGRRCALPPAPPTRFYFLIDLPCYLLSFIFFICTFFFGFIFSFLIFIYIHRDLSLCASFLVRIAGGGAAPSPLHPPTRFYFLIDFPCYLLYFFFFRKHRLFGFIFYITNIFILAATTTTSTSTSTTTSTTSTTSTTTTSTTAAATTTTSTSTNTTTSTSTTTTSTTSTFFVFFLILICFFLIPYFLFF